MARPKKIVDEPVEEKVVVAEDPQQEPEKKVSSKIKKFDDHAYILCHSVTAGGLGIIGAKTETYYRFNEYGAECDIEYIDLVQLVRSRSEHIFMPRIIIDNKDFLEEFPQVADAYNNMYSRGDLKEILKLPADQMGRAVNELPEGAKNSVLSLAATMVASGELDSIASLKTLSDIFGADFNLVSELFGER